MATAAGPGDRLFRTGWGSALVLLGVSLLLASQGLLLPAHAAALFFGGMAVVSMALGWARRRSSPAGARPLTGLGYLCAGAAVAVLAFSAPSGPQLNAVTVAAVAALAVGAGVLGFSHRKRT